MLMYMNSLRKRQKMFANPAKKAKLTYKRPLGDERMDDGAPTPPGGEAPPPPKPPRAGWGKPSPLSANKTSSIVIVALDQIYKEDSDGPGFIACECEAGVEGGLETYNSADKGGIFAQMDSEGSVNAEFPSINMESASTQLLVTPDVVISSQQNSMVAIAQVQVGDIKKMLVVAVIVTPETRQYLINNFLTQLMDQRFSIVGQVIEEVYKGKSLFSVVLYKGILNQTDFTPKNLSILHLQIGNVQEKVWDGKKISLQWVKAGFAMKHKDITAATGKEKFLLQREEDKLTMKANSLAIATDFLAGKTQDLPGEIPLKCRNFAGVGQVPIEKATLHPGATIFQNPEIDKSLFGGQSPKNAPTVEFQGKCVANFFGDQNPKEGTPTKVWHFMVSYSIYNEPKLL